MGLADFLAQAGNRTAIGQVAQAFGGRTSRQQAIDDFTNNQLPALLQEIHANTDETKIPELGNKFLGAALKAGMPMQGAEKMMDHLIGPALQGIRKEGLSKLAEQYRGQPAVEAQSRPTPDTEGPLTPQGNFIDPKAATPDKPLDLNFMMKFGQLTGAKPEEFNKMLETPATIAGKEASNRKTLTEINKEQQAQRQREGLSNQPLGPGQPSLQDIGVLAPASLAQTLPVREDQGKQDFQNQSLELRRQGLENQLQIAHDRIGAANDRADATTDRNRTRQATVLRKEFNTLSKNFRDVGDSYNRVEAATKSNDPMSQVAAIYNFIKMQDPNIVTGSEFNLIQNARPLLAKYGLQAFERAWNGQRLDPAQMNQLRSTAKNLYDAAGRQHQQRVQEYSRLAEQSDINPRDVITEMGVQTAPQGQGGYNDGPSGSGSGSGQGAGQRRQPTPEEVKAAKQRLGIP